METPTATPRVHAGCGHLCLTCGAKAARQWLSAPPSRAFRRLTHVLYYVALAAPVVSGAYAGGWFGSKPDAPPPAIQQRWSDATQSGHFRLTLIADKDGRATFLVPLGMMCVASSEQGPVFSATAGTTRRAVRAEPGSVIHVGCW